MRDCDGGSCVPIILSKETEVRPNKPFYVLIVYVLLYINVNEPQHGYHNAMPMPLSQESQGSFSESYFSQIGWLCHVLWLPLGALTLL